MDNLNGEIIQYNNKIKKYVILIFITFFTIGFVIILIADNSDTKKKFNSNFDDFFKKFPQTNNNMLFETEQYSVVKKIKRKEKAFTQGLFMDSEFTLIESSGLYGSSALSRFPTESPDAKIFKLNINRKYFTEGACLLNNKIYQLTWREKQLFVYEYNNELNKDAQFTIPYPEDFKEGWGLTNTENQLIISDGTNKLYFANIEDKNIKVEKFIEVKNSTTGELFNNLNELEYAKGYIYANVWMTNKILIIDTKNGNVVKYCLVNIEF